MSPHPLYSAYKIQGFVFLLVFRDRVSLCDIHGYPGDYSVAQAGRELTEIRLPLPPSFILLFLLLSLEGGIRVIGTKSRTDFRITAEMNGSSKINH